MSGTQYQCTPLHRSLSERPLTPRSTGCVSVREAVVECMFLIDQWKSILCPIDSLFDNIFLFDLSSYCQKYLPSLVFTPPHISPVKDPCEQQVAH